MNEAESLQFVRKHTDVPVPSGRCHFEDDGAYYLITDYVEGVGMSDLEQEQKTTVRQELDVHVAKLRSLTSSRLGGPSGIVIPP